MPSVTGLGSGSVGAACASDLVQPDKVLNCERPRILRTVIAGRGVDSSKVIVTRVSTGGVSKYGEVRCLGPCSIKVVNGLLYVETAHGIECFRRPRESS